MTTEFEQLLIAATRAPSGDNTQPWRFEVDADEGIIELVVDPTRDPSPMNSGQRMARIALGAAAENLMAVARLGGFEANLQASDSANSVRVRLIRGLNSIDSSDGPIEAAIRKRVTNRRLYDRRPVPADVLARLAACTSPLEGVTTHWIVGNDRLEPLARLIGRADATMFGEPTMRQAFLSKVRLDLPADAIAEDGLPLAALEASWTDRQALRLMPRLPNWMLKFSGGLTVFAKKARQLIESSSGLCMVVAPDSAPATDLLVGRVMQKAWVALTDLGLAAQPMMSLPVLENVIEHGSPAIVASVGREQVEGLVAEFRSLVPELGGGRLAWLMRFGYAPPPSGRTGRRSPVVVIREPATRGTAHV